VAVRGKAKGKRQKAKGKSLPAVAPNKFEKVGAEGVPSAFPFAFCLLPFAFCLF
jgi:hypothetical protein